MTSNLDIVERLRMTPILMYGDELNQSRIDYEACKRYINNEGVKMMREAAAEIERLRAERDEARREVCELRADIGFSRPLVPHMLEFAASRGWDCFKEKSCKK